MYVANESPRCASNNMTPSAFGMPLSPVVTHGMSFSGPVHAFRRPPRFDKGRRRRARAVTEVRAFVIAGPVTLLYR